MMPRKNSGQCAKVRDQADSKGSFFWLIWLCITVEFYFADSNLPYDKCVDSFILVRLKHNQFSQVHVDTTLENPGTLGSH